TDRSFQCGKIVRCRLRLLGLFATGHEWLCSFFQRDALCQRTGKKIPPRTRTHINTNANKGAKRTLLSVVVHTHSTKRGNVVGCGNTSDTAQRKKPPVSEGLSTQS